MINIFFVSVKRFDFCSTRFIYFLCAIHFTERKKVIAMNKLGYILIGMMLVCIAAFSFAAVAGVGGPTTGPTVPHPGPIPIETDDKDGDGIIDDDENDIGTDPNNADTDGDGLRDGQELKLGLDPNDWDTDNDKLTDGSEIGLDSVSTDGHFVDSDTDGI